MISGLDFAIASNCSTAPSLWRTSVTCASTQIDSPSFSRSSPEIMECHSTTGEGDYLIKVVAPDMKAYDRFLQDKVFKTPGVANVRSSVVLREVKYETALPVD